VTNGAYGPLRDGDERYLKAYKPYMDAYEKILEPYQVQNGGNLIVMQLENEFSDINPSTIHYMQVSTLSLYMLSNLDHFREDTQER
jgi:hypothetical protein